MPVSPLGPVELHELSVVDIAPEGVIHALKIRLVSVCGQLHLIGKPTRHIPQQPASPPRIPAPRKPRYGQLRIRADCRPRPYVAVAELAPVWPWDILFLGVAERPNFVYLDALTVEIAQYPVLILLTRLPNVMQQLGNGILGCPRHTDCRTNGAPLDQRRNHPHTFSLG